MLLSQLAPLSTAACAHPLIDCAVRLNLNPVLDRRAAVDGTWWPYTRAAVTELPGLIAAVDQRLGRITVRVRVHLDAWDHIPRHLLARGRQVMVGWFRGGDPRLITLAFAGGETVTLLVISPAMPGRPTTAALTPGSAYATGLPSADLLIASPYRKDKGGHLAARAMIHPSILLFSDRRTS